MGEFSITHILVIAILFLVFFGPSRLPQMGKSIGQAIRGFKQGLSEIDAESKPVNDHQAAPAPQQILTQGQNQAQGQTHAHTEKDKV